MRKTINTIRLDESCAGRISQPHVPTVVAVAKWPRLRRWLGRSALISLGLLAEVNLWAYGAGCPWCAVEPAVVASSTPLLHTTIKWCGIAEAPAIANPALVCEANFRDHMWRRHERASECIWIPQCQITLRSGAGFIFHFNYQMFNDLSTTIGAPGDIVVSPITEMDAAWLNCDMIWNTPTPQPKGIIAISARRLINSAGAEVARGIAYVGSITQPWMAVGDASLLCQLNERSLAHEMGHVLGLPHVGTAGNLMQTGGSGATLTPAQCTSARAYVSANPILDPPAVPAADAGVDRVAFAFDDINDAPTEQPFLDLRKIAAVDTTPTGGGLMLCLGVRGLVSAGVTNLKYWILLDTDNNSDTGGRPTGLVPGGPMGGVEFVCEILRSGSNTVATLYEPGEFGPFVPVLLGAGRVSAALRNINLVICDPFPAYQGPAEIPSFSELDFGFTRQGLIDAGLLPGAALGAQGGEGVFPAGLRIQAVAALPNTQVPDKAPAEGGQMQFPKIEFPVLHLPARAQRGELVAAAVEKLPPLAKLKVMFGPNMLPVFPETDASGKASFEFVVPTNAEIRSTLVTVGPLDPENGATADGVITVVQESQLPRLTIGFQQPGGNQIVVAWAPDVGVLQEADEVTGPWFDVPGATNPYLFEATAARRFYRLGESSVVPPEGPVFDLPDFSQLPADATGLVDVPWEPIPGSLNEQLAGQIRVATQNHPQVVALLGNRHHFISVTEVLPAKDEIPVPGAPPRALATFFSYANNWVVEARTVGLDVVGVTNRTDYQPHESESEIEEAIAAARGASNITASVQHLIGTGLLRPVDDPLAPGFGHRVISVGFVTNGGGDGLGAEAPLFQAEYDVNDRRILAAGPVGEPPAGAGLGTEALFPCTGLAWPTVYACTNNPAQSGNVNWTSANGNNWQFSWHANTGCGLAIRNVRFNGRYYLYKVDLPVVKVRYTPNVTGPFNDILNWGNMKCIWRSAAQGTQKVCVQSYFSGGRQYLVVWVYCCIGSYRMVQAYHFCDNGVLYPRLGSKGLQACANHVHCPFWQIDYDINGTSGNDRTWRFAPPWNLLPVETDGNQLSFFPLLGQDCATGRRVWVYGSLTGPPHFCCPQDYGLRLYKGNEGCRWPGGPVCTPLPWNNLENVNCRDDVLWQIGHLQHNVSFLDWLCAQQGFPGDFKWTGPCIRLD